MIDTWWTVIAEFPKNHPNLIGWFTSSVSAVVLLRGLWSYWKRPIIKVQLGKKAGSHAPVTILLKNKEGETIGKAQAKYLRLLITNAGLTTIKDCRGHLIKVTRRIGQDVKYFDSERHPLGWANYPQSDKRDIPRNDSFYMDVATLLLSDGRSMLYWPDPMPTTLAEFLGSFQGKAGYTFKVRVNADNARPKVVPVEIGFDPEKSDLTFVPLNTRYPLWRLWWWLRALWARRKQ
jgi:hypothetical protein